MADKKVYFNKPQRLTQLIGANIRRIKYNENADCYGIYYTFVK